MNIMLSLSNKPWDTHFYYYIIKHVSSDRTQSLTQTQSGHTTPEGLTLHEGGLTQLSSFGPNPEARR